MLSTHLSNTPLGAPIPLKNPPEDPPDFTPPIGRLSRRRIVQVGARQKRKMHAKWVSYRFLFFGLNRNASMPALNRKIKVAD